MSGVSNNAPVASKHLFLYQVAKEPIGAKVRFLCCVLDYEVSKAYLYVEHRHPQDVDQHPTAAIEISQVLGIVKSQDLQPGSWLNIIGYVLRSQSSMNKRKRVADTAPKPLPHVLVQAVLIWNAGAVKFSEYEKALDQHQKVRQIAAAALASTQSAGRS